MTTREQTTYVLSEEMQNLVYWSTIYSPADDDMDSIRAAYDAMCLHYTLPRDGKINVEDRTIVRKEQSVPVRVYLPKTARPEAGWPCVLYLHGGGWMVGGLDSHEFIASYLCQDLNAAVVSVDYRLAPEHRFPAAFEDCSAVYEWLKQQGAAWQIDVENIVLAGDSAGGNLAAALVVNMQHSGLQAQGLAVVYPCLSTTFDAASAQKHAYAPLLTTEDMHFYLKEYAPNPENWQDLRLAPLSSPDFSDMPATFVAVAEYDPLSDEGKFFTEKLKQAGISTEFYVGKGLLHGSLRLMRDCPEVQQLYQNMLSAIRRMFDRTEHKSI